MAEENEEARLRRQLASLRRRLAATQTAADRRRDAMGWFVGQVDSLSRDIYRDRLADRRREIGAQYRAHIQTVNRWMRDAMAQAADDAIAQVRAASIFAGHAARPAAIESWAAFRALLDRPEATLNDLRASLMSAQAAVAALTGRNGAPPVMTAKRLARRFLLRPDYPAIVTLRHRAVEIGTLMHVMTHWPLETGPSMQETGLTADPFGVDLVVLPGDEGDAVLHCLDSVWRNAQHTWFQITVPLHPEMPGDTRAAILDAEKSGLLTTAELTQRLAWEAALDWAAALHPARDVLLLKGDCLVYRDWLDRLGAAAYSAPEIGWVVPLSNNGGQAGYPWATSAAGIPADIDPDRLAKLCIETNGGRRAPVEAPAEFCMLFRRPWLKAGRPPGWARLVAGDTFVFHGGEGIAVPRPDGELEPFDSVSDLRRRIDCARMAAELDARERPWPPAAMLLITHDLGGGIERHVKALADRLEAEGTAAIMLRPLGDDGIVLSRRGVEPVPSARFTLPQELPALVEALRSLGLKHLHYHHLLRLPPAILDLPILLGLPYDFTFHDFHTLCPRFNMIAADGADCAGPAGCGTCAAAEGPVPVADWVARHRPFLEGARRLFAPSGDAAARVRSRLSGLDLVVRPHFDDRVAAPDLYRPRGGEPLRIAVVGALQPHKGSALVLGCAADAAARDLPMFFHVVGPADNAEALRATGRADVSGRYAESAAPALLAERRCHVMLLPSIVPETFSYTLSLALSADLWPVVFDLGAQAERLRRLGWGTVLDRSLPPAAVNDALLALQPAPLPAERRDSWHADPVDLLRCYYGFMPPE